MTKTKLPSKQYASENNFYKRIIDQINPDWSINISGEDYPTINFNTYVYSIDTLTNWIGAGSLDGGDFEKISLSLKDDVFTNDQIRDVAVEYITYCSDNNVLNNSEKMYECIFSTVVALTTTQTYKSASLSGINGHWLYLVYKMFDKTCIARPAFLKNNQRKFLSSIELNDFIHKIIEMDLNNKNSYVFHTIKDCGGIILSKKYKRIRSDKDLISFR